MCFIKRKDGTGSNPCLSPVGDSVRAVTVLATL